VVCDLIVRVGDRAGAHNDRLGARRGKLGICNKEGRGQRAYKTVGLGFKY